MQADFTPQSSEAARQGVVHWGDMLLRAIGTAAFAHDALKRAHGADAMCVAMGEKTRADVDVERTRRNYEAWVREFMAHPVGLMRTHD